MTTMAPDPVPAARRLARSYLFAPGNHERLLERVFTAGADAVVIDLEDAVAAEHKARARALVRDVLRARRRAAGPLVFVRVNSVQSGLWHDDLDAVVCEALDGIRLARTDDRASLDEVDRALTALERQRGLPAGAVQVMPTIESARGVLAAAEIAAAPRVRAFTFGSADFLHDISAPPDAGDLETVYARSHLVVVSRAANLLPPVASVHTRLGDTDDLRRTTQAARRLGLFGRSCIHPAQLPIVHEVFTPSATEIADARLVIDAFEAASVEGRAALVLPDGRFVDLTAVERARALVALAAEGPGSGGRA